MVATLERRIARLEAAPPPPPEEPHDDDAARWWHRAPAAVQAYLVAVDQEAVAAGVTPEAIHDWLEQRHPCFRGVGVAGQRGATTLAAFQREVLVYARLHLLKSRREAYGDRDQNLIGWESAHHYAAAADPSGERWVRAWRTLGAENPETRTLAGLHEAELALLAADEAAP